MNSAPLDHLVYGNVADPMHPQARGFRIVHGPSRFDSQALDALAKRFSSCAPKSEDPNAASMAYLPWMHQGEPYGCLVQHLQPLAQDDQGRPAGFFHALLFPRHSVGVDPLHNALACAASFHRESLDGNPARFLELVRTPELAGDPSVRVEDLTRVLQTIGGSDPVAAFVDAAHRVTAKSANADVLRRRYPTHAEFAQAVAGRFSLRSGVVVRRQRSE